MQVIEAQCTWSWRLTITLHINQNRSLAVRAAGELDQAMQVTGGLQG